MFLASNAAAFLRETRPCSSRGPRGRRITPGRRALRRPDGAPVERDEIELDWDDAGAEKGGYETYMLKEIYEQPEAVAETSATASATGGSSSRGWACPTRSSRHPRVVILACGTAYHAGVVGR